MSNNQFVQSAFPFVVFGAVAVSVVMSLVFLFTGRGSPGGSVYDQIGQGGFSHESDFEAQLWVENRPAPEPDSPAALSEREREVRQMLNARSERLVRGGQPALDIDTEVARLLRPPQPEGAHQVGLAVEVRQLVVARNERLARRGLQPLDVEAEVARTLKELDP